MAIAFIVFPLTVVLILAVYAIFRALVSRCADEGTLGEAIERSRVLHQQLLKLPDCDADDRLSLSQAVVEGLVKNSRFLTHVLWQWRMERPPRSNREGQKIGELRVAALGRAWKLHSKASKLSSRLRSKRPQVNWKPIAEAVLEHDEMWMAYSLLLKAEYPDKFASVSWGAGQNAESGASPHSLELSEAV